MQWYNEPSLWSDRDNLIQVTTDEKTDFWRKTHYGFIRDSGHFYYQEITGNFQAQVKISGEYCALYDQAGLMLRQDEKTWLKCGVELVDGVQQASVVVTRDYSDWSVVSLPQNPTSVWLRLQRQAETIKVEYSLNGLDYIMLRLAYLTEAKTVRIGLAIASPQGNGCRMTFEEFKISQLDG